MKARGKERRRMRNMKERFRLMTTFEGDEMRRMMLMTRPRRRDFRRYTDKIEEKSDRRRREWKLKEGEMENVKMKEEKKRESESTGYYANTFEKGFSVRIIPDGMMFFPLHLSFFLIILSFLSCLIPFPFPLIYSLYLIWCRESPSHHHNP